MFSTAVLTGLADGPVGILAEIGDSDCEDLHDAFLVQPVNAITSFAYVLAGVILAAVAVRRRTNVTESVVFGLCLVGVGLGSVVFHGPQWAGSRFLHDLPILITVVFIAAHDATLVWPRLRTPYPLFVGGSVLAAIIGAVSLDAAAAATGVVLLAVAALEFVIYRRRLRSPDTRQQVKAYVAVVAIAAVAGATWLLGRTDSPACDPDGVFQFHGLWHLLSALIFVGWWWLALGRTGDPEVSEDPDRLRGSPVRPA